ncbi:hypothetical protein SELMODRAFT_432334 [Selaginella moellendorffii]|uniref:NADP-dependent glyceraldehyde-3-phosphate dehydrogenase n=1 Tax=Selaginella moellendorffii TaxID=88036 RepID=D8TFP3_SELML|nr:hypothetical protein SELMODRAFT_432334 [Selaginella moellendorffii]
MELGGNAPCIVEDLVPDLEGTIGMLVHKGSYQSGQSCIHMQRLYMKGEVKDALIAAVKKLKGGDPRQDNMSIGPMISKSLAATVEKSVNEAVWHHHHHKDHFAKPPSLKSQQGKSRIWHAKDEAGNPEIPCSCCSSLKVGTLFFVSSESSNMLIKSMCSTGATKKRTPSARFVSRYIICHHVC